MQPDEILELFFWNSGILVVCTVIMNSILGTMGTYWLTRFDFKLKKYYYLSFLVGMLVPGFVIEISRIGIIAKAVEVINDIYFHFYTYQELKIERLRQC